MRLHPVEQRPPRAPGFDDDFVSSRRARAQRQSPVPLASVPVPRVVRGHLEVHARPVARVRFLARDEVEFERERPVRDEPIGGEGAVALAVPRGRVRHRLGHLRHPRRRRIVSLHGPHRGVVIQGPLAVQVIVFESSSRDELAEHDDARGGRTRGRGREVSRASTPSQFQLAKSRDGRHVRRASFQRCFVARGGVHHRVLPHAPVASFDAVHLALLLFGEIGAQRDGAVGVRLHRHQHNLALGVHPVRSLEHRVVGGQLQRAAVGADGERGGFDSGATAATPREFRSETRRLAADGVLGQDARPGRAEHSLE